MLIQLPENYLHQRKEALYKFLHILPTDVQFFLEVRHESWFANEEIIHGHFKILQQLNIGAVIHDGPALRNYIRLKYPVPKAFIKFSAVGNHALDYVRIEEWKKHLKYLFTQGFAEAYFFLEIHNEPQVVIEFAKFVQAELTF